MTPEQKTEQSRQRGDRPFPWCCPRCLKEEVHPEEMPYTTDVKHDGRSFHLEIPRIRIPKCRACGNLVFSHSVDDEVFRALREEARLLTPEQIKKARMALDLQSKELAERLGVAAETISRWERGGLIQSRAMDNLLRIYFRFPVVREALQGASQDPNLGTKAVLPDPVPLDYVKLLVCLLWLLQYPENVGRLRMLQTAEPAVFRIADPNKSKERNAIFCDENFPLAS
jgi:putative zinc finger/helix-turn-helix YgiT family protein